MKLRLLGPPETEADGAPIAFDTRKALALLAYLAIEGGSHTRDRLAGFLWPEGDLVHARGALRRTLSSVRKHLTEEQLRADRNVIELTGGVSSDVGEFRALMAETATHHEDGSPLCDRCVETLRAAASLHRGAFMTGFELKDSSAFDEWRYVREEELRKELAFALQQLIAALAERGAFRDALPLALRWVELDPLHEPAHVQVMRLHALNDDRTAALEHYRRLVRILDEELGVAPLDETSALERAIAAGTMGRSGRPVERAHRPGRIETPFVGRMSEVGALVRAASAARSSGRIAVIEGEAGIGKTRLAREVVRRAGIESGRSFEVASHEEESDHAYGLIARLLSSILEDLPARRLNDLDDATLAEITRLAPDLRSLRPDLLPPPPLADPGATTTFFHALWDFLALAPDGALLLLDDLQWSDPASIDVLAFVVRRMSELPALLILTWRSEEVARDDRIRKLPAEARRAGVLDHVVLARLERNDVDQIVKECLPSATHETSKRVYDDSEGLPFFVAEYVDLLATGHAGNAVLPEDALDIVRTRLEPIEGTPRQVLAAASVLGRSFDLALVQATAGRSDEETVDALEELVERSVIAEAFSAGELAYDFTHEKIRALVYEETSLARRRLLHGRAADFLTAPRPRAHPNDVALAAYHSEIAGRTAAAAELHVAAGERARDLFANAEALSHFERALALEHSDVGRLHESVGDMQVLLGRYESALRSYETAAAYAGEASLPNLERKLAEVYARGGDSDSARRHLERALPTVGEDDPLRAELLADLGFAVAEADAEAAWETAEQAVATGERLAVPRAVARAHNLLGLLARRGGRMEDAVGHLSQSLAAAEGADDLTSTVAALNNLALVRRHLGELPEAIDLTRRALDLCTRRGDIHRAAALHNNLADVLHESGDEAGSQEQARQAARLFATVGEQPVPAPEIWKLTAW